MVGKRNGREAVILSMLEKKTQVNLSYCICSKPSEAVMDTMMKIRADFGNNFSRVLQTITVYNGSVFSDFVKVE